MRKAKESKDPKSCFNRAKRNEMVFVLLGRDDAAPYAIRTWVSKRIALGKNLPDDPQIIEALECADTMEREKQKGK